VLEAVRTENMLLCEGCSSLGSELFKKIGKVITKIIYTKSIYVLATSCLETFHFVTDYQTDRGRRK
jgi:hypothetical protein